MVLFWQRAADTCRRWKRPEKRTILRTISLNRVLSDVTLCVEKRKPFDVFAERLSLGFGRGDWI